MTYIDAEVHPYGTAQQVPHKNFNANSLTSCTKISEFSRLDHCIILHYTTQKASKKCILLGSVGHVTQLILKA